MSFARTSTTILLITLGALLLMSANAAVWANRTVFDTDHFVATVDDALDDDDVQQQLATRLATELVVRGEVEARIGEALPDDLQLLSPLLTRLAYDKAYDLALRLIRSDRFRELVRESMTLVHRQVLRILADEGSVVFEEGKVILDLGVVLERLAAEFDADGNGLFSRLELPDDAGQIVLVEDAKTVNAVQELLALHDQIVWLVIAAALVALALGVLIANDRRRTLRNVAIVIIVTGILAVVLLWPIRPIVAGLAQNHDAGRAVFDAFVRSYRVQSFVLIIVGMVLLAGIALIGDGRMARTLRGRSGDGSASGVVPQLALAGIALCLALILFAPGDGMRWPVIAITVMAALLAAFWVSISTAAWAVALRGGVAAAVSDLGGGSARADTFLGRHALTLQAAGVALALAAAALLPGIGARELVAIAAVLIAWVGGIAWLARPDVD